ncbi:hypothetical protein [Asticcacaulis sp.]|uniref:hypothetical protein n=1 Tax=Asticcacaulis sp. TaxID=1872648 RepID=UPI00391CA025
MNDDVEVLRGICDAQGGLIKTLVHLLMKKGLLTDDEVQDALDRDLELAKKNEAEAPEVAAYKARRQMASVFAKHLLYDYSRLEK